MSASALRHRQVVDGPRTVELVEPEGPFDEPSGVIPAFQRIVQGLLLEGRRQIRVSCRLMTVVDVRGIEALVWAAEDTDCHGGRFEMDSLGNPTIRLFFNTVWRHRDRHDRDDGMAGKLSPLIPPPRRGAAPEALEIERDEPDPPGLTD